MKPTQPWSMARVASRRQLQKPRKMHGPVGEVPPPNGELRAAWDEDGNAFAIACKACGHDVCSCKPVERIEMFGVNANPAIIPKWRDARPGSVDVAGLEKLRAEWQKNDGPDCPYCGQDDCPAECRSDAPDDHARHTAAHIAVADRLGICGLCHSFDHKFMQCPDRARLYRESLDFK